MRVDSVCILRTQSETPGTPKLFEAFEEFRSQRDSGVYGIDIA